ARRTSIHQIARCHFEMATLLVNSGDWNQALVHARTAASIASDEQQIWIGSQCQAVLATILAYRRDCELARRPPAGADSGPPSHDSLEAVLRARIAAAAIGRAEPRPQPIIDALGALPP